MMSRRTSGLQPGRPSRRGCASAMKLDRLTTTARDDLEIIVVPALMLVTDQTEDHWLPLWCGPTAYLTTSLVAQSYVSRRRSTVDGHEHEWFVGPREVIVL